MFNVPLSQSEAKHTDEYFFSLNMLEEDLFLNLCLIFNYTEDDSQPDCSCLLRQCSICYGEVAFQFLLNTHKQRRWWMY